MAIADYSTTPSLNISVNGINIAENCPAANINNAIRQIMADVKTFSGTVPDSSTFMPKAGGVFSGPVTQTGKGQFRYNDDSALTDGRIYFLAEGAPLPTSPVAGMLVFYYT